MRIINADVLDGLRSLEQLIHKRIEKQEDNLPLFGRRGA